LVVKSATGNAAFSYGAMAIKMNGKVYAHSLKGSSMLIEFKNNALNRQEVVDSWPDVVNFDAGFKRK